MIRKPRVAGHFYPNEPDVLRKTLEGFISSGDPERAVAVISPHAGYIYSGAVAGEVYSSVEIPDDVILIGPNHTGLGRNASVMASGSWETPLGITAINEGLASMVIEGCRLFSGDSEAHLLEHSLEVQLPFIQFLNSDSRIVPVTVMHAGYDECRDMGLGLADAIKAYGKGVLIIVSSDMNHYEPDKVSRKKDSYAIDKILELDAKGLLQVTEDKDITMCGAVPAAIGITAAIRLGARQARLVKYSTSGEVNNDYSQVVGYAGIIMKRPD